MASMLSFFRRQQPTIRKPNPSRKLLLEVLEDRTVPSSMQLSINPHAVVEGSNAVGTVTRIGTDNSQALTVNLVSSDTTEATVPQVVVIPAGQASASFNITGVYDSIADGTQNATITATAAIPTHVQPDATFAGGSVQLGSLAQDMALQPDGKIVVAGMRYNGGTTNPYDFAVFRYRTDGTPDPTFGGGTGAVYTDVSGQSDRAQGVVVQPDGKIVVAGTGGNGPHFFWVLARYNPDGTLDTTFGSGGKIVTDPNPGGTYNEIWDVALQPDGRILAAGNISSGSSINFAVARYNPNGSLDTSFGSNGIAQTSAANRAYSVLVQPDGRIVLVGSVAGGNSNSHFALSRFYSWGAIDSTFGSGGTVVADLPGYYEEAFGAALQPDGKIVAVGQIAPSIGAPYNYALARYNPDGSFDSTFGSNGFVSSDMGGNDQAEGVVLPGDGRILVVGGALSTSPSTWYTMIADYNADGSLTMGYISRSGEQGQALAIQPDGKVVAVSSQTTAFGGFVERYDPIQLISGSDTVSVQDNTNPVIQPDAYDVAEDQTFYSYNNYPSYGVLSNDFSPNGSLTASLVSGPAHGTLTFNSDGSFVYTPAPNYNGPDSFVYRATDPLGMSGQATVSLTVWPMDDPILLSVPGPQTIAEDTSRTFSVANGNAITITDADTPRVLVAVFVQNAIATLPNTAGLQFYPGYPNNSAGVAFYADTPAAATAALNGLIVTPNPNYNGTIYMNVYAQDTTAGSSSYASTSMNVNITVTPVNDPPVAVGDSFQPYEDMTFTSYSSVLSNDSDPENDPLTAVLVSGPQHGTLNLSANGSFTYLAAPNYNGPDSFTYSARDSGGLLSAPATVTLNVWPVDDPIQVTAPGPQTIAEDTSLTFSTANGKAITITDIESPQVLVAVFAQNGILSLGSTAGLTFPDPASLNNTAHITFYADSPAVANAALEGMVFTPDPNYNGPVYFNVYVQDQTFVSYSVSASASTNITVTPVNDAPVAVDDSYVAFAGMPFITAPYSYGGNIPGVLWNDQDVDWNPLSAVLVSGPVHGTLAFNSDGSFTYTADSSYTGPDSFTYYASDGQLQSGLATATFTVTHNTPPVAVADAYTLNEDTTLSVPAPGFLSNDYDPEGQPLTYQLMVGQAHGSLTIYPDTSFTYTPSANYYGHDEFWYQVTDGTFTSDLVVVSLTVNPVNDAPVAGNNSYSVNEDNVLTVAASGVLANDSDVDSPTLSAVLVSGPSHGTVSLNADGSFTYTPSANYNGSDSFTYKASDGQANSNVATVSITVNAVNDAPVAGNDSFSTNEDVTLNGNVVGNDSDVEGSALSAALVAGPAHGSLTLNASGSFTYTPNANYNGPDSFSYKVSDGSLDSNVATVSITVNAVNDPPVAGNDSVSTSEDTAVSGNVLGNDTDVEGSALNAILVAGPAHGSLTLNASGSFTYTPSANYNGPDSFTYKANDGQANSNVATVSITVNAVNDAPVAGNDSFSTNEDVTLNGNVVGNDSDVEGSALSAALLTGPAHGSLTLNASGSFTYTPNANYYGPDSFSYKVSDGSLDSNVATVSITVNAVNDAPVAGNDSFSTNEDTAVAGNVLGNDTDVEGSALNAILVAGPAHGSLTLNASGSFTYTPSANYNGPDSFTYRASDGLANSNIATVSITVIAVYDAPVANNDSYTLNEDQVLNIAPVPGVTSLTMVSPQGDYVGQGRTYNFTPANGTFTANRNFDNGVSVHFSATGQPGVWWDLDFAAPFNVTLAPGTYANATRWPFQADNVPGLDVSGEGRGSNTLTGNFTVTQALYAADGSVLRFAATFSQSCEGFMPPLTGEIKFNVGSGPSGILLNDTVDAGSPLTIIMVSGPSHGTLAMNVDGSFKYTPQANYNGTDSFTYKTSDGVNESNVATVNLTINAVNDFPTANSDTYVVAEDNVLTVAAPGVLANDSDVDGDSLTATLVTSTTHGSLAFNTNGSFTYTPQTNYNGSDSFQYAAYDGQALSFIRTVTIIVTSVNDAPVAGNDSYTTAEDTPLTVAASGVLGNDTDVDSSTRTAILVSGPAHGTLTLNSNGSFVYTPTANYNGPDSFTYKANDGLLNSNVATVSLTVNAVNDAPVAGNDSFSIDEDTTLNGSVIGNDSDVEGSALGAFLVVGPAHGSLTLNADGSFTYTPNTNYNGSDSFTYKVNDGSFDSNIATVTLSITPVNDAPSAQGDSFSTNEDTPLTVAAQGVLANDSDVDGDALTAVLVTGPAHGTLSLNADGSFAYTPAANYNGSDSFTYKANDGGLDSNIVTVTLTINSVNDAPVAGYDSYTGTEDTVLVVAANGVLANDVDVEGDALSAILVAGPAHGTLTFNADGSFAYTPNTNYNGSDSFTYKANDGSLDSNVATVTLNITLVNDAPSAQSDSFSTNEDTLLTVAPQGVLANDSDVDGDALTAVLVTGTAHGTLSLNADGSFAYTPAANYNGSDSFTYKANDGGLDSNIVTVTLTINSVDDAPAAGNDNSYTGTEDTVLVVAANGVLANDSDVEGDALAAMVVNGPVHGTVALNADGSFTYTPNANYNGSDSFTYKANDGSLDSNVATVTLNITPVNDAPSAQSDSFSTNEDTLLTVAPQGVLANDSDVDGDALTAVLVTGTAHGTLSLNADGSFAYTPAANYNGSDSFTYKANDGSLDSNIVTVTLTINSVDDAPVAGNDSFTGTEDTVLVVAANGVLANDSDVEGDALAAILVNGPVHGTVALNADGSFTYTPNANYNGSDSFTYKANDGSLDSNVATVTITINAVNDAPVAGNDTYSTSQDTSLNVSAPGVLGNDSDVEGSALSAILVAGPAHGTLALNADGSFAYMPNANYNGSDSFTYRANDGSLNGNVATVALTITPVNHAPQVTVGPNQTVNEGATVAFTSTASDVDGDTLTYLWNFADGATATSAAPTHRYADNGTYTVTLTVNDGHGGSAGASLVVTVLNVAPTLTLSGASTVNEGSTYTLNLAASDPGQDTIASWTITWGDGNVQTVAGNPGSVSHTYADGPRSVSITATATDEDGTFTAGNSINVTVNNVAPTASISAPATGARGQTRTFTFNATDPSAVDQAGSFTFNINWGDGNSQPSSGSASQQVGHIYTAAGTYTVQITATDKDGGVSSTVQQTITINAVDLQAGTLVIGGTIANDNITIAPVDAAGNLAVTINGASQGTFATPTQIVIYGQAGGDQIALNTKKIGNITYYVTSPAVLFGDAGNDTLDARGSTANNILVGGAGTDQLQGGSGRDILIGGSGADTLHGNGGDDIVIGNSTDFDTNLAALNALMAEWGRTDADYTTRINHLNGSAGGGLNGGFFLNTATVHDDAALDQLYGEAGSDWFFYTAAGSNKDKLNDPVTGEVTTAQ